MTVNQLIESLNKIQNKNKPVLFADIKVQDWAKNGIVSVEYNDFVKIYDNKG